MRPEPTHSNDAEADALGEILRAFRPGERVESAEPLGRGHIHATWRVVCRGEDSGSLRYVAQRVNRRIFADPDALAANLERVSSHLGAALRGRGVRDLERRHLVPLRDAAGRTLIRDARGEPWRLFPYIEGSCTRDQPRSAAEAHRAAEAFGAFAADLADLPPDALAETIPRFHDLPARLAALEEAASGDPLGRAAGVAPELGAARYTAAALRRASEPGPEALPRRVVHNDCKLNNLLFDAASGEALCVVDLDTVMTGSAVFDFGELVRTAVCRAAEDERDLAQIGVDLGLFRALAAGYVAGSRGRLVRDEIRALALAGPRLALENGVRFLTDFLQGDVYFAAARPGHNLDRARAQLRLAERLLEAQDALRTATEELARAAPG